MKAHVDSLNSNPYSLVVKDGTLDLREIKRRDSLPKDHNTQVAGVRYIEGAKCPGWIAHITKITAYADGTPDPNLAAFIQRWAGYTLTGLVSEQKFFFGFGSGANGKNVTTEVMLGLLGTYAMRGSAKIITGDSREHETIIADLAGMRMVFIDEIPHGRINEARLKELTGTERVRARKIRKDSFEFQLRAKIWIAGNNRPNVDDSSEGFWRRLDLVPFDVTLPPSERVRDYAKVLLDTEGPGILNWALEGLRAYREQGLEPPERVHVAGEEYRSEQNTTGQWARDTFDVDNTEREWVPNKVLTLLYERWCREQNIKKVLSMRQLSEDLRHMKDWFTRSDKMRRVRWGNAVLGTESDRTQPERGWLCPPIALEVPLGTKWTVS
jgi:putative DNA primase/helicase